MNLLENKVTLVVPKDNPKGITSFDQLAEHLKAGDILMAMATFSTPSPEKIWATVSIPMDGS